MGRLIDADEMIDKYGEWYTEEGTEEGFIGTLEGVVYMMPTVEAITVPWIEAKMKRLKDMDNGFSCLAADILYGVLMDWRREQENENN